MHSEPDTNTQNKQIHNKERINTYNRHTCTEINTRMHLNTHSAHTLLCRPTKTCTCVCSPSLNYYSFWKLFHIHYSRYSYLHKVCYWPNFTAILTLLFQGNMLGPAGQRRHMIDEIWPYWIQSTAKRESKLTSISTMAC